MNGQILMNKTLRINAGFSFLSGIDFLLFDQTIAQILAGSKIGSLAPMGLMLIGFSVFVFAVSMLRDVNKYLVGAIIAMDTMWVIGSIVLLAFGYAIFTTIGLLLIGLVAIIIAAFAYFQTKGLRLHLNRQTT